MNKILLVGRIAVNPETRETNSGINYSRFAIIVDRNYGENQSDFIPIIAWRNQSDFVSKYLEKGHLVSIEGRFTSSTYENESGTKITRYEILCERVSALETKSQVEVRKNNTNNFNLKNNENIQEKDNKEEVPWELDL